MAGGGGFGGGGRGDVGWGGRVKVGLHRGSAGARGGVWAVEARG